MPSPRRDRDIVHGLTAPASKAESAALPSRNWLIDPDGNNVEAVCLT